MRILPLEYQQKIEANDDRWVGIATELADRFRESRDKVRQIRNFQTVAEQQESWQALRLFMLYQGARKQLDIRWIRSAVDQLEPLETDAHEWAGTNRGLRSDLHMAMVARVLGFTARACYVKTNQNR